MNLSQHVNTPPAEPALAKPALPPFSGDRPRCVKCGHEGAATRFMGYGYCSHDSVTGSAVIGAFSNERLHRRCRNCDYEWDEALAETA